ncbi:hypothetical protein TNCV_4768661 [Trichonephila clavipes]|nr:hypothetical protein TNCV_4768661 [Trichonephila clavipes]
MPGASAETVNFLRQREKEKPKQGRRTRGASSFCEANTSSREADAFNCFPSLSTEVLSNERAEERSFFASDDLCGKMD